MDTDQARELLQREREKIADLRDSTTESRDLDQSQDESTGELASHDQHLGDHAAETMERGKDLAVGEGLTGKMEEIDAALERIKRGECGVCQVCGREIADDRLEAVPSTRFCREHAESSETGSDGMDITQELGEG